MLLSRAPEDDSLLSTAIHKHRPEVVVYDRGDDDAVRLDRHALFGETKSILVAPIMDGARFLGGIELVDPLTEFDVRAENAVMYVCDRYAQFLREHGTAIGNVVAPPSGIVFTSSDAPPKDEDARAAAG